VRLTCGMELRFSRRYRAPIDLYLAGWSRPAIRQSRPAKACCAAIPGRSPSRLD